MNNRRKLIVALGAGALAAPLRSFAQQRGKVWRIGMLETIPEMFMYIYRIAVRCLVVFTLLNSGSAFSVVETKSLVPDVPESYSFDLVRDMVWGDNQYVAVGAHGLILTTDDGRSWATRRWAGAGRESSTDLRVVAWGNRKYVAIASNGLCLTSTDGVAWKETPQQGLGWLPRRIRSIDNKFYVIGSSRAANAGEITALFVSSDAETWRRLPTPPDLLADVAGGDGQLVLLTRKGIVYKSADGATWHANTALSILGTYKGGENHRIVWNGSTYVALQERGWGSVLATSKDGLAWVRKEFQGYDRLYDNLIWNDQAFIAAGTDGVAVSPDGNEWQIVSVRVGQYPMRHPIWLAGANGTTILAGLSQERLKTGDGNNWRFIPVLLTSGDGRAWQGTLNGAPLPELGSSRAYMFSGVVAKTKTEQEELKKEKLTGLLSSLAIGFGMSGLSLLIFGGLQFMAIRRMHGVWRLFAWLPMVLVVLILAQTVYGLVSGSNLWPLALIFLVPLTVLYLLLLLAHFIYVKLRKHGSFQG